MRHLPVVILAAGEGRRLSLNSRTPKPLARFAGMSLLERAIRMWRRFGFGKFYVVVGHAKEEVARAAKEIGAKLGVSVETIENKEWPLGNGTSVLAASRAVDGPFFLQMVDHVFDSSTIEEFLRKTENSGVTLLAVDPRVECVLDLEDAMKIKLSGNRIARIGKELDDFDVIDMGLFFCTPEIFESLRESRNNGGGNLVDGVRWLAGKDKIRVVPITTGEWFDIDKPEILKTAENRLFKKAAAPGEGIISRHLNRRISFRISKLLASRVPPDAMTLAAFLIAVAGAVCFLLASYPAVLAAGILVQLSSVLDGCDGEIARIRLESSPRGAWFDTILDRYADTLIVAAVTYNMWLRIQSIWVWIGGLASLLAFLGVSYMKKEYQLRTGREVEHTLFERLTRRDLRLFGVFVGAVAGSPYHAMIAVALLTHAWMLHFTWTRMKGEV